MESRKNICIVTKLRRLNMNYERKTITAEILVKLAGIKIALNKLG